MYSLLHVIFIDGYIKFDERDEEARRSDKANGPLSAKIGDSPTPTLDYFCAL